MVLSRVKKEDEGTKERRTKGEENSGNTTPYPSKPGS
jgi:hypothetical protein